MQTAQNTNMVRILIISDIHLWSLPGEHDQYYPIRRKLLDDIKDYADAKGCINHILISGDIANTGAKTEYEKARAFIKDLCLKCQCPEHEVYVVPGNHDKNFNAPQSGIRHLIHAGMSCETTDVDKHLYDILQYDVESANLLYSPFKEYHTFASTFDSIEPLMAKCLDDKKKQYNSLIHKMYVKYPLSQVGEYQINLYGINNALISDWDDIDDDNKGHKLFLPKLAYNIDAPVEGNINILMMHHPLSRIKNGTEIQKVLDSKFQIQVFGHLHKPASDDNNAVHILSGAFQPPIDGDQSEYFSVYNILELEEGGNGSKDNLNVQLYVEKYDKETFEHFGQESKTFKIELKKRQPNRWLIKKEGEKMDTIKLPDGVTLREIRFTFLQSPKAVKIMQDFGLYDSNMSLSANSVHFLKTMEETNRLSELWIKLKE